MKIVNFSKKNMKTEFFKVVEFSCFSTENGVFHTFLGLELQQIGAERWH